MSALQIAGSPGGALRVLDLVGVASTTARSSGRRRRRRRRARSTIAGATESEIDVPVGRERAARGALVRPRRADVGNQRRRATRRRSACPPSPTATLQTGDRARAVPEVGDHVAGAPKSPLAPGLHRGPDARGHGRRLLQPGRDRGAAAPDGQLGRAAGLERLRRARRRRPPPATAGRGAAPPCRYRIVALPAPSTPTRTSLGAGRAGTVIGALKPAAGRRRETWSTQSPLPERLRPRRDRGAVGAERDPPDRRRGTASPPRGRPARATRARRPRERRGGGRRREARGGRCAPSDATRAAGGSSASDSSFCDLLRPEAGGSAASAWAASPCASEAVDSPDRTRLEDPHVEHRRRLQLRASSEQREVSSPPS